MLARKRMLINGIAIPRYTASVLTSLMKISYGDPFSKNFAAARDFNGRDFDRTPWGRQIALKPGT